MDKITPLGFLHHAVFRADEDEGKSHKEWYGR